MRRHGTRLLAVLTALMLMLGALPETWNTAQAADVPRYGKTTATGVAVRIKPDTKATYHFRVDIGTVCAVTDVVSSGGSIWYKVVLEKPGSASGHTYIGYIKGDCFTPLTDMEIQAWEANPVNLVSSTTDAATGQTTTSVNNTVAAVNSVSSATGATGQITNGGVNFREGPSLKYSSMFKLERGNVVELLSIPSATDADPWYKARYNGMVGYVQGKFVRILTTGTLTTSASTGTTAAVSSFAVAATAVPTAAPVATAAPAAAQAVTAQDYTGYYARLALTSANLRKTPSGEIGTQWVGQGSILPIVGASVNNSGYVWYPVNYNGTNYYVRGDCVQITSMSAGAPTAAPQAAAAAATIAPVAVADNAPATPINASLQTGYVQVTSGDVNLRLQPSGEKVDTIKRGTVVPVYGSPVAQGGYNWFYVLYNGSHGYLRSEFVMICNADGTPGELHPQGVSDASAAAPAGAVTSTVTAPVAETSAASAASSVTLSSYGYVKTVADKVNLRQAPSGKMIEQVAINTILPLTGVAVTSGQYVWYPVQAASGSAGYLRGDCVTVTDVNGAAISAAAAAADPTTTTTSTNAAATTTYGYVMVTKSKVNFRSAPGGGLIGTLEKNTVWPMIGAEQAQGGYTWFPISMNGTNGYVRGDCAFKLNAAQQAQYLSGTAVTGGASADTAGGSTKYIITTADKLYLRQTASKDSGALAQLPLGIALEFTATTVAGGVQWYNVNYNTQRGWLMGTYVQELTEAQYKEYIAAYLAANPTAAPAANTTAATGSAEAAQATVAGYVKTTKSSVNVRVKPGSTSTLGQVAKGQVFAYSTTTRSGNYTWYLCSTNLGEGYIRGDCVEEVNADGNKTTTVVNGGTAASAGVATTPAAEASYSILKLGSTSTAVRTLTQALKDQGYYNGTVTNQYTTSVEEAVKAFQRAKGLTVDGIAGEQTQHALFGTVPVGSANTSDLTMTLYQAEKIDWYTGGIQELLPRGTSFKIYDVQTGIVWWAHRWAGGSHADIEPLTSADTARLCQIYGVTSAKQIASKNLWQRRPCLITIGNRTFACSLYGVPHNYGAGDIKNNGMDGQVCLHFTNSRTHGSKKVDSYHAAAIQYAWEHAPNGHK